MDIPVGCMLAVYDGSTPNVPEFITGHLSEPAVVLSKSDKMILLFFDAAERSMGPARVWIQYQSGLYHC